MKKMTLIAFTGFYLALSLGFSLNLHYCGGKLAAMSVVMNSPTCCCDVGTANDDCCSDASIALQMDVDQQLTYPPSWELSLPALNLPNHSFQEKDYSFSPQIITPYFPNPPPLGSQAKRVKMVSLTYYG